MEVVVRLHRHRIAGFGNLLEERHELAERSCAADYDPELGWSPKPARAKSPNHRGTVVTITPDGLRAHSDRAKDGPLILAVGDSYAFGDEVNDRETWESYLEGTTRFRVANAGVCGYGIDQSWLRAAALVPKYRPSLLIFSFIGQDIERAEWSAYPALPETPKPYFAVTGDTLELRNVPVPRLPEGSPFSWTERTLGYSFLADALMLRLSPSRWGQRAVEPRTTGFDGVAIGCRLAPRLAMLGKANQTSILALVQGSDAANGPRADRLVDCLRSAGIRVLDLRPMLGRLMTEDPARFRRLIRFHMTAEGNAWVAAELAKEIAAERI